MKKLCFIILLFLTSAALWTDNITFRWAVFRNDEILNITPRILVNPGDKFKFYIHPVENAYIYLFVYSNEGSLSLLFPKTPDEFSNKEYWGQDTFIPPLEEWYELPGTSGGEHEFFFIASPHPLNNLDKTIKKTLHTEKVEELYRDLKTLVRDYKIPGVFIEEFAPITGTIKSKDPPPLVRNISSSTLFIEWFKLIF